MTRPKVFISYSHDSPEHKERVRELAQQLRGDGVDAWIDQFEPAPVEGWPRCMQNKLEESDFTLAVCTATYKRRFEGKEDRGKGKGGNWEGFLTTQMIYDNDALNERCIPVLLEGASSSDLPLVLAGSTRYHMPDQYDDLLRHLTDQPAVIPAPLGPGRTLPPEDDGR